MDMTPFIPEDRQVIDSYGPGRFRIANVVYECSVIVFPDRTIEWPVVGFHDRGGTRSRCTVGWVRATNAPTRAWVTA
jgi:hypothetical protein